VRCFGVVAQGEGLYLREENGVFGGGFLCALSDGREEEGQEGGVEEGEAHFGVFGLPVLSSRLVMQVRLRERVLGHEEDGKGRGRCLVWRSGKDRLRRSLTGLMASPKEHSLA
jgi:hypothetical protein